jgi:hypothetical protein
VDSGYIVYVGKGQDAREDRAHLKAEGQALEDLANECSFPPKGARVEDHFDAKGGDGLTAYAKVGVTFDECEGARNATDPEAIRQLASPEMMRELDAYHQFQLGPSGPPANPDYLGGEGFTGTGANAVYTTPPPLVDDPSFYVTREQIYYTKRWVYFAPVATFAVGTPLRARYLLVIQAANVRVANYWAAHPEFRNSRVAWSTLPGRPAAIPPLSHPVGGGPGPQAMAARAARRPASRGKPHPKRRPRARPKPKPKGKPRKRGKPPPEKK